MAASQAPPVSPLQPPQPALPLRQSPPMLAQKIPLNRARQPQLRDPHLLREAKVVVRSSQPSRPSATLISMPLQYQQRRVEDLRSLQEQVVLPSRLTPTADSRRTC